MAWQRHQAASNRNIDAMEAEIAFRTALSERYTAARAGRSLLRTASAVPVAGSRWRPERHELGTP